MCTVCELWHVSQKLPEFTNTTSFEIPCNAMNSHLFLLYYNIFSSHVWNKTVRGNRASMVTNCNTRELSMRYYYLRYGRVLP